MSDDGWIPWALVGVLLFYIATRPSSAADLPVVRGSTLQPQNNKKVYTNMEEWEIIKDRRGRVTGVRAKRRSEEAG